MKTKTSQALRPEADEDNNEYILHGAFSSCWITVGKRSVHVVRRAGKLKVAVYPLGGEDDEPIGAIETTLK